MTSDQSPDLYAKKRCKRGEKSFYPYENIILLKLFQIVDMQYTESHAKQSNSSRTTNNKKQKH